MTEFKPFPKISRLSRPAIVTEKLDGTNAQILITDDGRFYTGSRNRLITPENDNYGFSRWAHEHKDELMKLGPGQHFGEWWGPGIQRGYGIATKRFSLFNTARWSDPVVRPACCSVVPILAIHNFDTLNLTQVMDKLREFGSVASPGFMRPEGIVIFHAHSGALFKKTFEGDETGKGQ